MNSQKQCEEIHEKVVLAAYGELPDDEAHSLATHLEVCLECREELEQLLALKTLSAANPMLEPDANLVARSRQRLEDALDALPPRRWYDRVAEWMTRTASALQAAPAAAFLLLVAGVGAGSLGGYEFAERHALGAGVLPEPGQQAQAGGAVKVAEPLPVRTAITRDEVAGVSAITARPNSNLVEVSFNQVQPRQVEGTIDNPQIRELLMLASQNSTSPAVRDASIGLLSAACRSARGCDGKGAAKGAGVGGGASDGTSDIRQALIVALRYDRSAAVRRKALDGLEPYVGEDMRVRNAVLEALLNDPEAGIRSAAISMLEPVEADTSVRQVLSTVALSDQNSHIRDASRVVLRRVAEIQ